MSDVQFTNNSDTVLMKFGIACIRALERCGLQAEGYAKDLCPVDTGNLRNSISHRTSDHEAFVGTNSEYGTYVELGTGIYAETGGRQTPWTYRDAKGDWHMTRGQRAQPYLKPAIADHAQTYKNILENELKNG